MDAFDYSDNLECFYMIPLVIFALETFEKRLLIKRSTEPLTVVNQYNYDQN